MERDHVDDRTTSTRATYLAQLALRACERAAAAAAATLPSWQSRWESSSFARRVPVCARDLVGGCTMQQATRRDTQSSVAGGRRRDAGVASAGRDLPGSHLLLSDAFESSLRPARKRIASWTPPSATASVRPRRWVQGECTRGQTRCTVKAPRPKRGNDGSDCARPNAPCSARRPSANARPADAAGRHRRDRRCRRRCCCRCHRARGRRRVRRRRRRRRRPSVARPDPTRPRSCCWTNGR